MSKPISSYPEEERVKVVARRLKMQKQERGMGYYAAKGFVVATINETGRKLAQMRGDNLKRRVYAEITGK
jgi:hypothetical protein